MHYLMQYQHGKKAADEDRTGQAAMGKDLEANRTDLVVDGQSCRFSLRNAVLVDPCFRY